MTLANVKYSEMGHFGETLRELIRQRHFGIDEYAHAANISTNTLYRNLRSPVPLGRPSTLRAMAKTLGLTTPQLDALWREGGVHEKPPPAEITDPLEAVVDLFRAMSPTHQRATVALLSEMLGRSAVSPASAPTATPGSTPAVRAAVQAVHEALTQPPPPPPVERVPAHPASPQASPKANPADHRTKKG